jgi:hypothetical protein
LDKPIHVIQNRRKLLSKVILIANKELKNCYRLRLCTNNFGGTKLKRNYILGYVNRKEKVEYHWHEVKLVYLDVTILRRGVGEVRVVAGRGPAC